MMVKQKFTILYVDDEPSNLNVFKNTFKRDYKVITATSGEEGLKLFKNNKIDLIITDQRMPSMTGIEFLEKVIELNPEPNRLILTGFSDFDVLRDAINKGAIYQFVQKPWDEEDFKSVIDAAIEAFQLRKQNKELIDKLNLKYEEISNLSTKLKDQLEKKEVLLNELTLSKKKLKGSEKRFKDISLTSADWIWEINANGEYTFASGKVKQVLGYEPDELIGKYPIDIVTKEDAEKISLIFESIFELKQPFNEIVNWNLTKDGRRVCLSTSGTPIFNKKNELTGFRGVNRDITARIIAEKEKDRIFNNSIDMLCISRFDGYFRQFNPAWTNILGWSAEELYSKSLIELVHHEDRESTKKIGKKLVQGKKVISFRNRCLCKDGTYKWLSWNSFPIQNEKLVYSVTRDITDQIYNENLIRKSEQQFKDLLESAPDAVIISNKQNIIVRVNEQFEQLFGYKREEIIGQSIEILIPKRFGQHHKFAKRYINKPQTRAMGQGRELLAIKKNGEEFPVDISISPIQTEEELLIIAAVRDITQRKIVEKNLLETKRELELIKEINDSVQQNQPLNIIYEKIIFAFKEICHAVDIILFKYDGNNNELKQLHINMNKATLEIAKKRIGFDMKSVKPILKNNEYEVALRTGKTRIISGIDEISESFKNWVGYEIFKPFLKNTLTLIKIKHFGIVPLTTKEEKIGLITFAARGKINNELYVKIERLAKQTGLILQRIKFEESLKKSEARLKEAQEIAKIGHWNLDIINNKLEWSDEIYRIFGIKPQEFPATYEGFLANIHPEDREMVNKAYSDSLKTHNPYDTTHRLKLKDGTIKFVNEKCESVFDESGNAIYSLGIVHDITDQKLAEEKLNKSEKNLRLIYDTTGDILYHLQVEPNDRFRFLTVNHSFLKATGLTEEQIISKTIEEVIPEPSQTRVLNKYKEAIRENRIVRWEETSEYPSGIKVGDVAVAPVFDKDGICTQLIGSVHDITEYKRVEDEIRKLNERLEERVIRRTSALEKAKGFTESILDSLPGVFYAYNEKGQLKNWNSNYLEITGFTADKITDINPLKAIAPQFKEKVARAMERVFKGEYLELEAGIITKDGTVKPYYLNGKLIESENEKLLIGVGIDLSAQKEAQSALIESEEKFRSMTSAAYSAIIMIDNSGNVTFWNNAAEKIFGWRTEEILGKNIHSMITPSRYKKDYRPAFSKFRETGKGKLIGNTVEITGKRKNGEEFPVEISLSAVKLKGKWNAIGIINDITIRKKSEAELKKLSEAVKQSPATVMITDTKGRIQYVNPKFSELTGYSFEEALNKNPRLLNAQVQPKEYYKKLWGTIKDGKVWHGEFCNKKKNGDIFWESASISPVKDSADKITHFVAVKEDITERKKMEVELQKAKDAADAANKAKSEFLANMSHEIRTPMNAILGFSEILSKRIKDQSQIDYLDSIQSSGKILLQLINDILDLNKIESGKLDFSYEPVNIQKLVQDTVSMLKVKSDEKDLQLNRVVSKGLPGTVYVDELRIKQILINLINNSVKFTEQGYIEIVISYQNKTRKYLDLVIKVEDTGIGISEKNHPKIFRAFDQIEGSDSKKYEGTGLGLAITKHIVNKMNGTIELESKVGKGSIFTIVLNKVKYSEDDIVFEESINLDSDSIQFEESTVLIVDDIKTNRDVLKGYMTDYEINIVEAENGEDALTAIDKYKPDLIFLDLRMPVMDGYEVNQIIMRNPKWSNIPVIAITASAFDIDEKKVIKLGFKGYVRKPASLNDILQLLKKYLKHTMITKKEELHAEVTNEPIYKLDEVLLEIDNKAMPVLEEIKIIRTRENMLQLTSLLIEIGENYNAIPLINYGNELHLAFQSFDINKEKKLIQQFPDFVKKLNSW